MEHLSETLRIRVTKADKASFEKRARKAGLAMSTWTRIMILAACDTLDEPSPSLVSRLDPEVVKIIYEPLMIKGLIPAKRRPHK